MPDLLRRNRRPEMRATRRSHSALAEPGRGTPEFRVGYPANSPSMSDNSSRQSICIYTKYFAGRNCPTCIKDCRAWLEKPGCARYIYLAQQRIKIMCDDLSAITCTGLGLGLRGYHKVYIPCDIIYEESFWKGLQDKLYSESHSCVAKRWHVNLGCRFQNPTSSKYLSKRKNGSSGRAIFRKSWNRIEASGDWLGIRQQLNSSNSF